VAAVTSNRQGSLPGTPAEQKCFDNEMVEDGKVRQEAGERRDLWLM